MEGDATIPSRLRRRLFQAIHRDEPLLAGEPRLDLAVAPVAVADDVAIRPFLRHDESALLERFTDACTGLVSVEPTELLRGCVGDRRVGVQDVEALEPSPLRDLEVVRVVRRSDLHCPRAEVRV